MRLFRESPNTKKNLQFHGTDVKRILLNFHKRCRHLNVYPDWNMNQKWNPIWSHSFQRCFNSLKASRTHNNRPIKHFYWKTQSINLVINKKLSCSYWDCCCVTKCSFRWPRSITSANCSWQKADHINGRWAKSTICMLCGKSFFRPDGMSLNGRKTTCHAMQSLFHWRNILSHSRTLSILFSLVR